MSDTQRRGRNRRRRVAALTKGAKRVMRGFQKQYGKEGGRRVFYAVAAKQGRNPRTFRVP